MKSLKKIITVTAFVIATVSLMAQNNPPTPNNGNDPTSGGSGNTPVGNGGGAPIGGGLFILLGLGAAYGGRKTYKYFQEKKEILED